MLVVLYKLARHHLGASKLPFLAVEYDELSNVSFYACQKLLLIGTYCKNINQYTNRQLPSYPGRVPM